MLGMSHDTDDDDDNNNNNSNPFDNMRILAFRRHYFEK